MSRYYWIRWHHPYEEDPVLFQLELDEHDRESRKIETFRDGRRGFAGRNVSRGGAWLGELPVDVDQVASLRNFTVGVMTEADFEEEWYEVAGDER